MNKTVRSHKWKSCRYLLASVPMCFSVWAHCAPVISNNRIDLPDTGWHQVQSAATHESLCEGVNTCEVAPGRYIVINHSTGERWDDVFVSGETRTDTGAIGNSGSAQDQISINGLKISWTDDGWYQVQQLPSYAEVCAGGTFCEVPESGWYVVINHSTGKRYDQVNVGQEHSAGSTGSDDNNPDSLSDAPSSGTDIGCSDDFLQFAMLAGAYSRNDHGCEDYVNVQVDLRVPGFVYTPEVSMQLQKTVLAQQVDADLFTDQSYLSSYIRKLGPDDLGRRYSVFDYDGPGIGEHRECTIDIDCTPARSCDASHIDCTPTRNCSFEPSKDTRDCSACIVRKPFGGCLIRGNDPFCEAAKASQNAIYAADHTARKADCERLKSTDKLFCETSKTAWKADCERIRSSDKLVCETDKSAKKFDCERLKEMQQAAGEVAEAFIHGGNEVAMKSAKPVPDFIYQTLKPFFPAEVLDNVYWTTERDPADTLGNFTISTLIDDMKSAASQLALDYEKRGAITLSNVIVFREYNAALFDAGLWAHELEHVMQYQELGIEGFADYTTDYYLEGGFTAQRPTPQSDFDYLNDIKDYITSVGGNVLEGLASIQSLRVCKSIDPDERWHEYFLDRETLEQGQANICRSSFY